MIYNSSLVSKSVRYALFNVGAEATQDRKKIADIIKLESMIYIDRFNIIKLNSNNNDRWFLIQSTEHDNNKLIEYSVKYMDVLGIDNIYIKLSNESNIKLMYHDKKSIPVNITSYNTTDMNNNSVNIYNENYNFTLSVDTMYKIVDTINDINMDSKLEYLTHDSKWVHYDTSNIDDETAILEKLIKYNKIRLII